MKRWEISITLNAIVIAVTILICECIMNCIENANILVNGSSIMKALTATIIYLIEVCIFCNKHKIISLLSLIVIWIGLQSVLIDKITQIYGSISKFYVSCCAYALAFSFLVYRDMKYLKKEEEEAIKKSETEIERDLLEEEKKNL